MSHINPFDKMGMVNTVSPHTTGVISSIPPGFCWNPVTQQLEPLMGGSMRSTTDYDMMRNVMQNGVITLGEMLAMRIYQARPDLRPAPGGHNCFHENFDHWSVGASGDKVFVFLAKDGQATVLTDERKELFPSDNLVASMLVLLP